MPGRGKPARGVERRGVENVAREDGDGTGGDGRDEEEKRSYATMPAEVHSRTITDARRGLNEWLRKPWAL